MTTTVTAKIVPRQGTAAAWTSANPTLLFGERGIETDTGYVKLGDGVTEWNDLDYVATEGTIAAHIVSTANPHSVTASQVGALAAGDDAANLGSGLATDGYVLTADGLGGAAWEEVETGAVDHGALTGLDDDDHSQYHTDARGDARYAVIANGVTGGDSHDHSGGDGAQIAYSGLSGLPTLGTAAATDTTAYVAAGADAADLTSGAATDGHVLTADGAGGAAWEDAAGGTPEGTAILSTGETGGTKYLREDGDGTCSWQTPAGGDLVDDTTPQLGGDLDLNGNQITGSGGTVTTSQPIIDVSQTWNDAAVAFTGINVNITNTASNAAGSTPLNIKVNGSSILFLRADGKLDVLNGIGFVPDGSEYVIGKYGNSSFFGYNCTFDNCAFGIFENKFRLASDKDINWCATTYISTIDLTLARDAANTLAQRNSTNPQTYRLYNTYTDASNYERLALKWGSNVCTITTEALGTGTLRGLKIGEAATSLVGFYGVTPVVQQASADQAVVTLGNANSEISDLTFSASPTQAECQALRDKCEELADDVRALSTLVHSLRTALLNTGLIKGAA